MPADTKPLIEFIDSIKGQGASDEFVVALLRQNGWSEKRIYGAFGAWYESRMGLAAPNGGGRIEGAKDAFLYLLAFITLGIWTIQLGALLFTVIDQSFPNPAFDYSNQGWVRGLADKLAGILVAFPLFALVMSSIVRGVQRQPERLESPVRKWLTYIALVITASTMILDAVTFLAYFLRGDLSSRFILKVVTVLVIAAGVFAYYLDSLRHERLSPARNRLFAAFALTIVGVGLTLGFMQIGSPSVQQTISEDARRLYDLSSLSMNIHSGWSARRQTNFMLPATVQDVWRLGGIQPSSPMDPVNGQAYEYVALSATGYRLCAKFSGPSPSDTPPKWRHSAGRVCFVLDARDEVQPILRQR